MVVPAPTGDHPHQERLPEYPWPINACVARPVGKKEIQENPKAKAALQKEWDRLRQAGCWDETKVRSWREVAAEARQKGETHHVGRIFAICVEKNAELAEDNPARKYKGRVVFQGNQVKDENWEVAMFQELSSSPATMEASKVADCFGIAPGHVVEQADAEQAYTQSKLGGVPTWVSLPRDQWPKAWEKYDDPVCPLVLALYGHPDSGGYWERHCEAHLLKQGFEPVPYWRSCYWHAVLSLFLVVYVDDFKMSGPKQSVKKGWTMIQQGVRIGAPEPVNLYLGCYHRVALRTSPISGKQVPSIEYDMEDFLRACVDRYKDLAKVTTLRAVSTPFTGLMTTSDIKRDVTATPEQPGNGDAHGVAPKPEPGKLQPIAARVLMKLLYAARMARYDLLKAVNTLACFIHKWDMQCDVALHRLMCYVASTIHIKQVGWVGNALSELQLHLFADADFAGCPATSRSTSGLFFSVRGADTNFPITAGSKRQGCVSHSTPEAELVAADYAMRTCGLPALHLWERLLKGTPRIQFHEDNTTAAHSIRTGRTNIRHLGRTHRVALAWLHERLLADEYDLLVESSALQAADIFTKAFTDKVKWKSVCDLILHVDPKVYWVAPSPPAGGGGSKAVLSLAAANAAANDGAPNGASDNEGAPDGAS